MGPFSVDFGALGTRARSTCESAWLGVLHHRPVKEPSSRRIISRRRLRARAWSSWYVTFFDGARHAEGSDVERYGARERTEEEGRIRRRPWRTRGGEGEAGRDARYLRIQIKSPGRHVGEKKSGAVYRSSSYLTARPDSEIYLAPPHPKRFARLQQNTVIRSSHWANGRYSYSRFLNKNFLHI